MIAANENKLLIDAMLQADFYTHPVSRVELIETHISLVFLTGDFAYKVKKPVNFGFLDFTHLERRKFYCEEELRLNSRLAEDIYLDVVSITKSGSRLQLNGQGDVIEYAIRMRQFDSHGLLNQLMTENRIQLKHIEVIAEKLARFHADIQACPNDADFGSADAVMLPVQQNFDILLPLAESAEQREILIQLQQYSNQLHNTLYDTFVARKQTGHIKECHGDLHLGNIALSLDKIIIFDGIEFNDSFRWIDTMSDIAFLVMDLQDHNRDDYAAHFLNRYLELSGDYQGLSVLRFYQQYRAMVRAKVAALRMQQQKTDNNDYSTAQHQLHNYLHLASRYTRTATPFIAVMHGVSGSGKSWIAQQVAAAASAIIIRSDQERKRLFADAPDKLYTPESRNRVYDHLLFLAGNIIHSGYAVIIDATFLERNWRMSFKALAAKLNMPFHILNCHADIALLERRIRQRQTDSHNISDADIAVMHKQLQSDQHLSESELEYTIDIDTGMDANIDTIMRNLLTRR